MIKFGIVGAGSIAEKFVRDIRFVKDVELVAIASRTISKSKEFAAKHRIPKAFGSYEALAKSGEVDAVYIATPHRFHKANSILFLNEKIHVLCEKPIAVNHNEFVDMVDTAKKNKVLLMEAMWTRFLPSTKFLIDLVESQKLGNIIGINLNFGFALPKDYPKEGRLLNPELAGGSLLDLGCYLITMTDILINNVLISADVKHIDIQYGVDFDCEFTISYINGVVAKLHSSFTQNLDNTGVIHFEEGTVKLKQFHQAQELDINGKVVKLPYLGEGFVHEIQSFVHTLQRNEIENDIMTYDTSSKIILALDELRAKGNIVYPFE